MLTKDDLIIEGLTKSGEVIGQQKGMVAGGMPVGIRITHRPTGIVIEETEARNYYENFQRAKQRLLIAIGQ